MSSYALKSLQRSWIGPDALLCAPDDGLCIGEAEAPCLHKAGSVGLSSASEPVGSAPESPYQEVLCDVLCILRKFGLLC